MVLGREVYRMTAYCQDSKSRNPDCSGFLGGGTPVFAPIVVQRTGADHEHAGRGQPYLPVREQARRDCEVAGHLQVRGDAPASENASHDGGGGEQGAHGERSAAVLAAGALHFGPFSKPDSHPHVVTTVTTFAVN